ncbi:uncharacterized protein LOC119673450 [Teleopsis dalmanni]|uniref:uncharacterized protein LOC119673450 n=1 Tax=Teleopsis dalmanni TaxID=139649 RepID=UPI0018CF8EBC|nr:uncharacterized protein LOC119673450 [Teleopsis dalmanni]
MIKPRLYSAAPQLKPGLSFSNEPQLRNTSSMKYEHPSVSLQNPIKKGSNIDLHKKEKPKDADEELYIRKSLYDWITEDLDRFGRSVFYKRFVLVAKNREDFPRPKYGVDGEKIDPDTDISFYWAFRLELDKMLDICYKSMFLTEKITGLFLCMGEYTILLLEGAEEFLKDFNEMLVEIADKYWLANKIFHVEDKINETYFQYCASFRCAQMNINEKFPPNTVTDKHLIVEQHNIIKEKLLSLYERLSPIVTKPKHAEVFKEETWKVRRAAMRKHEEQKKINADAHFDKVPQRFLVPCSFKEVEEMEEQESRTAIWSSSSDEILEEVEFLPPLEFNKLLPEAQRIDIVLNCERFYRSLRQALNLLNVTVVMPDEEALIWPIPYNFLPLGIFERSPYDVNLTFPNYKVAEVGEEDKEEDEEIGEEEEAEEDPIFM